MQSSQTGFQGYRQLLPCWPHLCGKGNDMLKLLIMLAIAVLTSLPARAAVSVDIGINVPAYPTLRRIPGYPVYYVPRMRANYFFYDGLYWVYAPDGWYASPWYDGPWDFVPIDSVPLFILRIPVRYYGYPPVIFRQWVMDAPPRWDRVWGPDWAHRHPQWQHWNRAATPAPAPLPRYQQRFTRANYPNDDQRRELAQQHYRYTPHDKQARQHWQSHVGEVPIQPRARPAPHRESRPQPLRTQEYETRAHDRHTVEHNDFPAARHAPPRGAALAPPEPQHRRAEEREFARSARPEHGEHPGKPKKEDHEGGHDRGKHHQP